MKKVLKVVACGLGVVVVLIALGLGYLYIGFPDVGPVRDLTVTATPERLARGAYLANHVSVCVDCHSTRDWNYFADPIVPGTEGKGGELFGGFNCLRFRHNSLLLTAVDHRYGQQDAADHKKRDDSDDRIHCCQIHDEDIENCQKRCEKSHPSVFPAL